MVLTVTEGGTKVWYGQILKVVLKYVTVAESGNTGSTEYDADKIENGGCEGWY
jgi:hypothetical protein